MSRTVITEKEVFTFDELSDKAKETAREWMRDGEREDFDPDFTIEDAVTVAAILGIDIDGKNIRWQLSYMSGDGASFAGRYSHAEGASTKIREDYPTETTLHEIADGLTALQVAHRLLTGNRLEAKIERNRYGSDNAHSGTMYLDSVTDSETGEEIEDSEVELKIRDLMREFADWIFKSIEGEYEWLLSDENIDERLKDGDYEFDEDGEVI